MCFILTVAAIHGHGCRLRDTVVADYIEFRKNVKMFFVFLTGVQALHTGNLLYMPPEAYHLF